MTTRTSWQARVALTGAALFFGVFWSAWYATAAMLHAIWRSSLPLWRRA